MYYLRKQLYSHRQLVYNVFWTPIPQVGALNWGARCMVQTLPSSGRSWELGIFSCLYGALLRMEFVARVGLSLSTPFWCGYFLSHLMYRSHSMCSCTFGASLRGGKLRSHLCPPLGQLEICFFLKERWDGNICAGSCRVKSILEKKCQTNISSRRYGMTSAILSCHYTFYMTLMAVVHTIWYVS